MTNDLPRHWQDYKAAVPTLIKPVFRGFFVCYVGSTEFFGKMVPRNDFIEIILGF